MQSLKYRFGRGTPVNNLSSQYSTSLLSADTGVLFNFNTNRPTNSVSVENIPDHVDRREIVSLFNGLIGEVRSFQDVRDALNSRLDITFFDRDSAAKAMCMNGYTVANVPLHLRRELFAFTYAYLLITFPSTVSALTMSSPVNRATKISADDRRNLYVLGLPFALTKNEFTALFGQYGSVSHCVILATVDNSSRRRGFVVMSSHEEARQAMLALTHTTIKGHTIDVSWAVVQRSQGFLDGGDRAMLLDSPSHLSSPSPKLYERGNADSFDSSDSSLESHDADPASVTTVSGPTTSLLVTNLPTLLFSQAQDLHPLFFPFGHIEKLEIVQVSPLGTMSVLVQYSRASVAQEAKESLTGQLYGSYRIEARYVKLPLSNTPQFEQMSISVAGGTDKKTPLSYTSMVHFSRLGSLAPQTTSLGGPIVQESPNFETAGSLCGGLPRQGFPSISLPRRTVLSAINPPFSNVFNDSNDSSFAPSNSRWFPSQNYDRNRQYASSNQMHSNTVYPNTTA